MSSEEIIINHEKSVTFIDEGSIIDQIDFDYNIELQNQAVDNALLIDEIYNQSKSSVDQAIDLESNNTLEDTATILTDASGSLVGRQSKDLNDLYELYGQHATQIGFSVRKSTQRLVKGTLIVKEKHLVCNKEGKRCKAETNDAKKRKVPDTRTQCDAKVIIKLVNGMYVVVDHVIAHNHPLTRKQWQYLHRSERHMTKDKVDAITEMHSSGMKTIDQFNLLCTQYGGKEFIGHTRKDHYNFVNKLKIGDRKEGDAQNVINLLCKQQSLDPGFFFRFLLDDDNRLICMFFRDSMMREDFEIYDDVLVYDTTHNKNAYNLVCSPFVGVNNHWSNVMFGCAFLDNEKTESFEWLFEVFKESMGGKYPKTIFTDQDQAISTAITMAFPEARHRLCLWHIQKNAVSYFGNLKSDTRFKGEFRKCLMECNDKDEFEECWESMLTRYNLHGHSWFDRLYDLKEKWCTALSKDFFSAGIISSQRSESTNNALGFKATKRTSLTEFYRLYCDTVDRWRTTEGELEFKCSRAAPIMSYKSDLLKHAAEIYTITLYEDFDREFCTAVNSYARIIGMVEPTITYEVALNDKYERSHKVAFNPYELILTCTCRNYEETGWLCFHCIRVMHINSLFKIPDRYIKKRWTKYAKSEVWARLDASNQLEILNNQLSPLRNSIIRKFYSSVLKCKDSKEALKILEDGHKRDMELIEKLMGTTPQNDNDNINNQQEVQQAPRVMNPPRIKSKGRQARKKGHFERRKGRNSTTQKQRTPESYIAPERLF